MPETRPWALTRGFALHPGTRNRYKIRYTRTQHRPPSRQVNDHGRVSGTHRALLARLRGFGSLAPPVGEPDNNCGHNDRCWQCPDADQQPDRIPRHAVRSLLLEAFADQGADGAVPGEEAVVVGVTDQGRPADAVPQQASEEDSQQLGILRQQWSHLPFEVS